MTRIANLGTLLDKAEKLVHLSIDGKFYCGKSPERNISKAEDFTAENLSVEKVELKVWLACWSILE